MIRTVEELAVVRQQLVRAEDALLSLKTEVLPYNARNFEVLSESYLDMIRSLRKEIDAFIGIVRDEENSAGNGWDPVSRDQIAPKETILPEKTSLVS